MFVQFKQQEFFGWNVAPFAIIAGEPWVSQHKHGPCEIP